MSVVRQKAKAILFRNNSAEGELLSNRGFSTFHRSTSTAALGCCLAVMSSCGWLEDNTLSKAQVNHVFVVLYDPLRREELSQSCMVCGNETIEEGKLCYIGSVDPLVGDQLVNLDPVAPPYPKEVSVQHAFADLSELTLVLQAESPPLTIEVSQHPVTIPDERDSFTVVVLWPLRDLEASESLGHKALEELIRSERALDLMRQSIE